MSIFLISFSVLNWILLFQATFVNSLPEKCLTCIRALPATKTGLLRFLTTHLQSMVGLFLYSLLQTSYRLDEGLLIGCSTGGLHHAAARIAGENVYRHLKLEGGTHRVQRIPEVGLSSRMQRIHTGTMTVIILPQPVEVHLPFWATPSTFHLLLYYISVIVLLVWYQHWSIPCCALKMIWVTYEQEHKL